METDEQAFKIVKIANFVDRLQADYAQSYLESNGIPAQVVADDAGGLYSNLLAGNMGTWLAVTSDDTGRATELLQELNAYVEGNEVETEAMSFAPPINA